MGMDIKNNETIKDPIISNTVFISSTPFQIYQQKICG